MSVLFNRYDMELFGHDQESGSMLADGLSFNQGRRTHLRNMYATNLSTVEDSAVVRPAIADMMIV